MTDNRIKNLETNRDFADRRFDNFQQEYRRDASRTRKRLCSVENDVKAIRDELHAERKEHLEDRQKINDIYTAMRVLIWIGKAGIAIGGFSTALWLALKGDASMLKGWFR